MNKKHLFVALAVGPLLAAPAALTQQQGQVSTTSPDRRLLISAVDRTISITDAQTQQERLRLQGHTGAVSALAISPDGKLLASASQDKSVALWDLATGKQLRTFKVDSAPTGVTFAADGRTLTSREADGTVRVWDLASGKELRRSREK